MITRESRVQICAETVNPAAPENDSDRDSLGDVQKTLLIPLYFRAKETKRPNHLFEDRRAVEILPKIQCDFFGYDRAWALEADVVVRTVIFDDLVRQFIERYPNGQIINLGCGLDARFDRLDNGLIQWFDLDMPDSIALRQKFIQPSERNTFIDQSMFDTSWLDRCEAEVPTLIVAEALFFYFERQRVEDLLIQLHHHFTTAELLFQSVSPGIVGRQESVPVLRETRAELRWGVRSGRELEGWYPGLQFIDEWSLVDHHVDRWRWYRYARSFPWLGRYLREVMKITHMRFVDVDG